MSDLQSLHYKYGDTGEYIDRYAGILDRLESMSAKIADELAVIMFLHSMGGKFETTIAALHTMGDQVLAWEDVTARLIEETNTSVYRHSPGNQIALVSSPPKSTETCSQCSKLCSQCSKPGHSAGRCWWNPKNSNNKISNKSSRNKSRVSTAQTRDDSKSDDGEPERSVAITKTESKLSTRDKFLRLTVTFASARNTTSDFLLDSDASAHMCPNRNWFKNLHPISPREIKLGDNSVVTAEAAGDMVLNIPHHTGETLRLLIGDVLYIPKLGLTLISCSRLAASGISKNFHSKGATSLIAITMRT
jgi:gag-polypeptide of LTR copia-type